MIDASNRKSPCFPADKDPVVKAAISDLLDRLHLGPQDIAICVGVCGGDFFICRGCAEARNEAGNSLSKIKLLCVRMRTG